MGRAATPKALLLIELRSGSGRLVSSLQLFLRAVLLTVITRNGYGNCHSRYWGVLAFGFYFLALDEGAQVHELLTPLVHTLMGRSGIARPAWFIPATSVVAVIDLSYLRFLLRQPIHTAIQFVIGGSIVLCGAVGFEIIETFVKESTAAATGFCDHVFCGVTYGIIVAIEEGMEMIGVTIFANHLLHTLLDVSPRVELRFDH